MALSKEWDECYKANAQMSVWPWSDLVSYVKRHASPLPPGAKVLELGCGAGANIPFFRSLGADYSAMDGSGYIIEKLRSAFPELADRLAAGDFTERIPFDGPFDLVVDRAGLTHSTTAGIKKALALARARMKPGAKYIGIDWFSTAHSDYAKGVEDEDRNTRTAIKEGQFAGVGRSHFSDKAHIVELFAGFELRVLEHKTVERQLPEAGHMFACWNLVAVKQGG